MAHQSVLRHSGFGFLSLFVIRYSSFDTGSWSQCTAQKSWGSLWTTLQRSPPTASRRRVESRFRLQMNNPPPPSDEHEELAHADDTIIGRAVRWSLVAGTIIAVVAAGLIFIVKRKPAPPRPKVTQLSAPTTPDKPRASIPAAMFTDIT